MKIIKYFAVVLWSFMMIEDAYGQDPNFSQFFSSPLNINPALTGNIKGKWRVISNYRSQWIGPASPYNTGTVSFDSKIFQNVAGNYVDENTRVGIGGMMMYDQAMGGALKSSYASLNASGNIRLKEGRSVEENGYHIRHNRKVGEEGSEHKLGIGIGAIYGHKRIDYSQLSFGEQFNGFGFDTNLPSGEAALSNMKPYFSTSAGITYSYINENTNFDLGVAAFHLNKPKQTFLDDKNQYLAARYVVHANFETFLSDQVILNTNGVYQTQARASYFSIGGALGYYLPSNDKDVIVNAGLWYWSKNAMIPYLGFTYGNFQVGLTYDITTSSLKETSQKPKTFELCLILRGEGRPDGIIPSPWK